MELDLGQIFFQGWSGLVRTAIVGVLAYLSLVVVLRVSGKRTLSKMNAFDLVVTVALGSILATIVLSQDIALLEGVVAFAVLIGMQFIIAWLSVRSQTVSRLVKAEPRLLVYDGHLLHGAMRDERVVEAEVLAAVRQQGIAALEAVEAVVLETDGSVTVIPRSHHTDPTAIEGVAGYESHARERGA